MSKPSKNELKLFSEAIENGFLNWTEEPPGAGWDLYMQWCRVSKKHFAVVRYYTNGHELAEIGIQVIPPWVLPRSVYPHLELILLGMVKGMGDYAFEIDRSPQNTIRCIKVNVPRNDAVIAMRTLLDFIEEHQQTSLQ
jgi:hypothetical protein